VRVGRKRVERIMRENGRRGAYLRKGRKGGSTKQNPRHTAAPDLLERDFTTTAPNRKWVADLTRIPTGEGVLWLASVRDVFSNKVVGWRSGPRADTELVLSALDYALFSRDVQAGELIFHSDKGCQYTAVRLTQRLVDAGIAPSNGSVGDSFGNALAENLWSTLKIELMYWPATTFATRSEAEFACSAISTGGTTREGFRPASRDSHRTNTNAPTMTDWVSRMQKSSNLSSSEPARKVSGEPGEAQSASAPNALMAVRPPTQFRRLPHLPKFNRLPETIAHHVGSHLPSSTATEACSFASHADIRTRTPLAKWVPRG
jgi:transposase InsO family protein